MEHGSNIVTRCQHICSGHSNGDGRFTGRAVEVLRMEWVNVREGCGKDVEK